MAAILSEIYEGKEIFAYQISIRSQSTAEILLLPVAENKRPPYLNSTPDFNFDLFTVMGI